MAQLEETPDVDHRPYPTEVSVTFDAGVAVIRLSGEIDLAVGEHLDFAAQEAIVRDLPVRVDLSRVTFIDSTGLGFVATLARASSSAGRRVMVIAPSELVMEALTFSGLAPALDVLGTDIKQATA